MKMYKLSSGDIINTTRIEGISSIVELEQGYGYYINMNSGKTIPMFDKDRSLIEKERNDLTNYLTNPLTYSMTN
jgi:hypothetical protein